MVPGGLTFIWFHKFFVVSASGRFSAPYVAAYNISKYGVEAFSDALRREMSMWQVRVIIIEPSTYATAISEPALAAAKLEKLWNGLDEEMRTEQKSFYKKCKRQRMFTTTTITK